MIDVIGNGRWGKNIVRTLSKLGALGWVSDMNQPDTAPFSKVKESDAPAVAIATPADTHYDLAKGFLELGKHVFVEKPMTLDSNHARELCNIAKDKNLVLMVGHIMHYNPAFKKMKELVHGGRVGVPEFISAIRFGNQTKREEGMIWSLAPHDVSMIMSLVGDDKARFVSKSSNGGLIEFPSETLAGVSVDWDATIPIRRLTVIGTEGTATFDDLKDWNKKLMVNDKYIGVIPADPLMVEMEHFITCINDGLTPVTDGREGLCVTRVLQLLA